MPQIVNSRVTLLPYHLGQQRVMANSKRFNVLRCGRRWGKTSLGIRLSVELMLRHSLPVGWIAGSYKVLDAAWREIKGNLGTTIIDKDEQQHRIEVAGGGSLECWSLEGTDDPARGRRYARMIVDEAGIAPNLRMAWLGALRATLTDYHGDAWFLGTPKEEVPYFSDLYEMAASGREHWAAFQLPSTDNPYFDPTEIDEARSSGMPEWMVQREFYGVPSQSDTGFFRKADVEAHRAAYGREPVAVGRLACAIDDLFEREAIICNRQVKRMIWTDDPRGPWRFWEWWDGNRPAQDEHGAQAWCMGVDLAYGVGSSNTVASVVNADTRQKVAEFVSPGVTPDEAAQAVAMMGLWLGGRLGNALVNFESNGPGEMFTKSIRGLKYGHLYHERRAPTADSDDPPRVGWRSGPTAKRTLLEDYRAALSSGRLENPSLPALAECLTYRVEGEKVLSHSEYAGDEDDASGARVPHGDRVIADALAWSACQQIGRQRPPRMPVMPGTLAYLLQQREDERRARERW